MLLGGHRTFVGLGFGPIQSGLFLAEAFASRAFGRLVVVEVLPGLVNAVREAKGLFSVNVAYHDRVEPVEIGPVEIYDPADSACQDLVVGAIAMADELATALPSVAHYASDRPGSAHRLLARGLREKVRLGGPPVVVYAAENHNHAAEVLERLVLDQIPAPDRAAVSARACFVNTVIGKMSRVVADPDEVSDLGLVPLAPGLSRAVLVESFNQILISRVAPRGGFVRGITALQEKEDLLPFEEAKLYGHNAAHALAGYLGGAAGIREMADLPRVNGLVAFVRRAFIEESGEALVRKYAATDPLFTREGFTLYADDLLERMLNPFLHDTVQRVTRDTERKLGWDDRLIGTMRLVLENGIEPRGYALGTAAAVAKIWPETMRANDEVPFLLRELWGGSKPCDDAIIASLVREFQTLDGWRRSGFQSI